jgi:histidine triad (HIT) family protein
LENCIFCKIVKGEIPSQKVYEDDRIIAFNDIQPAAPIHILIIPKKHIESVAALEQEDAELIGCIFAVAKRIAEEAGINNAGYRVVTNIGKDGGQTVQHLHYHLLGGRNLNWPPG